MGFRNSNNKAFEFEVANVKAERQKINDENEK